MKNVARRYHTSPVRVLKREADGARTIEGYAAVFYNADQKGTEYALWSDMVERIMPGAFDRALREKDDARGLFNHDANFLLGRVSSNTLRLSVDGVGLKYEIDLPDTQAARDVATAIERGDLTGSSFAFIPTKVTWIEEKQGDSYREIRQIEDVELFDVGPVTYPAYEATTTGVRNESGGVPASRLDDDHVAELRAERDAWRRENGGDAVAVRARLVQLDLV